MQSVHPSEVNQYHPPIHVAKQIIQHAIRNIPGNEVLFEKIEPKSQDVLMGLKPHEYNSTGQLQFGFIN